MTFVAFADYRTPRDVECCKQRRRTVPEIGMGTSFRHARCHGQDCLFAVQRLDLGFLVDAQHDRAVRWRHVKTDNIPNLVDKERVRRQFEGFSPMRLSSTVRPQLFY